MSDLTKEEREILEEIVQTWEEADMPLSGGHSYQEVIDLLAKLGVENSIQSTVEAIDP